MQPIAWMIFKEYGTGRHHAINFFKILRVEEKDEGALIHYEATEHPIWVEITFEQVLGHLSEVAKKLAQQPQNGIAIARGRM